MLETAAGAVRVPITSACALIARLWPADGDVNQSLLTPGGYPAEFSFGAETDQLRITVEPGPALAAPQEKSRRIAALTGHGLDGPAWITNLAAEPGQRFGCWLALRFDRAGGVAFKTYQEIVPAAAPRVRDELGAALGETIAADWLAPALLGIDLQTGELEVYGRIPCPRPRVMHALFAQADTQAALPAAMDHLAALAGIPGDLFAGGLRLGASLRLGPTGTRRLTLFLHSCHIAPDNRGVRRRIEALADSFGIALPAYRAVCESLTIDTIPFNLHGLIGMTVQPDGRLACNIGMRPFSGSSSSVLR